MVGDCFNQLRLARQRTLNDRAVVSEPWAAWQCVGCTVEAAVCGLHSGSWRLAGCLRLGMGVPAMAPPCQTNKLLAC